ncbi:MAG TPA: PAS domain S-box protein, partial [Acidimicrobiia bacterium]|nr:PAS domain S-box protein [Acidimicrobiia bacterium]
MRARVSWTFLCLGALAIAASRLLPGETPPGLVLDAVGAAAAIAVVFGVRRCRPHDPLAWYLIAGGVGWLVAGNLAWDTLWLHPQHDTLAGNVANACYLAAYPVLALGLLRLVRARARTEHGDLDALADSAIIVAAALLPAWQFLIEPAIDAGPVTFDTVAAILFPLLDLLIIGALARVLFSRGTPSASLSLLFSGLVVTLFADIAYLGFVPSASNPGWLKFLWPTSYLLIGASALHPSMRVLTEPVPRRRPGLAMARIALLASALVVGPAIVIGEHLKGHTVDARVLGPVSALVAALVMWRLIRTAIEADEATRAVRESEERFRSLVQHASDVIVVIAPDGSIKYVSPGVITMLGSPPETYVGTMMDDHVHPDDLDNAYATLAHTLGTPGVAYTIGVRLRHRDGSWRWVEAVATGRVDEPSVQGVVCNLRDVDERKRTEALQAGEARVLDLIARGAPLPATLTELIQTVEGQLVRGRCSIRLLDAGDGAMVGAIAPSLPQGYVHQLDRLVPVEAEARLIPPEHAVTRVGIIDLTGPDRRPGTRELAREHGLRWCWMVPIVASESERVLGTFAVYIDDGQAPNPADVSLVERAQALAAVAIDRSAAEDRLEYQALHDPLTELP